MPFSEGYLHSPEYQRWAAMQQYAMEPQPLLTPGATIAKMLQGGVAAYGAKKSQAQYDAKQSEKASLLASLLQKEPVSDVAVTPALDNPETSGADLQQRQQMGAYNQPTSQAPDTSAMLAKLLAGGNSDAGSELVNQLAPVLMQQQMAQEQQANAPITPYQRAQIGETQANRQERGRVADLSAVDAANRDVQATLDRSNQRSFQNEQGIANRQNAMDIANIRAESQLGTAGNVQSVQPLGDGTLLKVFRDGHTELTKLDGTPVKGARNDPGALFNQRAAESAGKAAGVAGEAEPVLDANWKVVSDTLTSFDDPKIKAQAGKAIGFGGYLPTIPGVNSDFKARVGQLQGQAFLQAYNTLKGGGAITEVEGAKATESIVRLNKAQTPDEFYKSLDEAKKTFQTIYDAAKTRAARGRGAVPQLGGGDATPQAAPQAAPDAPRVRVYNPQTGKLE